VKNKYLLILLFLPFLIGWKYINFTQWEDYRMPLEQTKSNPVTDLPDYDYTNVGYLFPPNADVLASEFDIHYHVDSVGSNLETSK
jgi:hypothetical protein